jgi:hypothetical protein
MDKTLDLVLSSFVECNNRVREAIGFDYIIETIR